MSQLPGFFMHAIKQCQIQDKCQHSICDKGKRQQIIIGQHTRYEPGDESGKTRSLQICSFSVYLSGNDKVMRDHNANQRSSSPTGRA